MSIRQSNNKFGLKAIFFLVFVLIVGYQLRTVFNPGSRRLPSSPSNTQIDSGLNPIMNMLGQPEDTPVNDGIAVGLLLDVSGSMSDKVKNSSGRFVPKITIAQQSALATLQQIDDFSRQHTDVPVIVGLYEFSVRDRQPPCRTLLRAGPLDMIHARQVLAQMVPKGGTPIGDALITAKRDMDALHLKRMHLLVITDGENNSGYAPEDVVDAITRLPQLQQAGMYFVAFDIAAERFNAVRDAGGLVLGASNETDLQQTLDYILKGKILAEQPEVPQGGRQP